MKTHWQNLNRDRDTNRVIGPGFWYGRRWFDFDPDNDIHKREARIEWTFGAHAHHTMLEVATDFVNERELCFNIGMWHLFCLYFSVSLPFFPSWSYEHGDRQIGIRVFDGAIWIDLWRNDDEWRPKTHWWQRQKPIVIHPMDILFGREKHTQHSLSINDILITMPEGDYPATIEMYISKWKRHRWPFARYIKRANVELERPIPVPGKGENSWDLDDNAIYSLTCKAETIEEAISQTIQSALRDRKRYGGSLDWRPENS